MSLLKRTVVQTWFSSLSIEQSNINPDSRCSRLHSALPVLNPILSTDTILHLLPSTWCHCFHCSIVGTMRAMGTDTPLKILHHMQTKTRCRQQESSERKGKGLELMVQRWINAYMMCLGVRLDIYMYKKGAFVSCGRYYSLTDVSLVITDSNCHLLCATTMTVVTHSKILTYCLV